MWCHIFDAAMPHSMSWNTLTLRVFVHIQVLNLSPPLAVGLILVSCCPGGQVSVAQSTRFVPPFRTPSPQYSHVHCTVLLPEHWDSGALYSRACMTGCLMQASNVATYIAHGDVALSVLMTTASTLGAIVMTPLLTKTLAGTLVPVDAKVKILRCTLAHFGSCGSPLACQISAGVSVSPSGSMVWHVCDQGICLCRVLL